MRGLSRRWQLCAWLVLPGTILLTCGGCMMADSAVLYADTHTMAETGFTLRSPQYAYNDEPVTFDFAPDYRMTHYAIFIWPDGSAQHLGLNDIVNTYFRAVRSFKGAVEPREYRVEARGFNRVGESDWYYDRETQRWEYFPMSRDAADRSTGSASMVIRCYLINLDLPLEAGGRRIERAELSLIRYDGSRTTHIAAAAGAAGAVGGAGGADAAGGAARLVGPDRRGNYRLLYTPVWSELNRTGTTELEVLIHYADGTQELKKQTIDTP